MVPCPAMSDRCLSSSQTFYFKVILPVFWIGFIAGTVSAFIAARSKLRTLTFHGSVGAPDHYDPRGHSSSGLRRACGPTEGDHLVVSTTGPNRVLAGRDRAITRRDGSARGES
jgi:hypothetical protein